MTNFKKITVATLTLIMLGFTFTSCSDDDDPITAQSNYSEVLTNIGNNVIVKTYANLKTDAQATVDAANNLAIGDEAALTAAKEAWVTMRIFWENSESTLFGPAGDELLGVDGNIDAWPIDLAFVNTVLNGNQQITVDFIANQDSNAKGFHALEYLLWGIDGQKTANQLTAREIEYIQAASQYIKNQTTDLHNEWANSYVTNITNPTTGIYRSQIGALLELTDGMVNIATEVGTGKIETPLNGNNGNFSLEDEESRFSNNSKADFADNIRGILNIYTGDFSGTSGTGISDIVAAKNPELDTVIKNAINEAISGIENIPGTFTDAIQNNRPAVSAAQAKVINLETVLNNQLRPFIEELN